MMDYAPICVFCGRMECACDWQVRDRRRVAQAAIDGQPIRTVDYVCHHASGFFDIDQSKAHGTSERQRRAIQDFHKTHTLKRRPDFPAL